jgi:hypothetical protein
MILEIGMRSLFSSSEAVRVRLVFGFESISETVSFAILGAGGAAAGAALSGSAGTVGFAPDFAEWAFDGLASSAFFALGL